MMKHIGVIFLFCMMALHSYCQDEPRLLQPRPVRQSSGSGTAANPSNNANSTTKQNGPRKDSLGFEHRNDAKDSLSISFRYLDSVRNSQLDFSINDFYKYFTRPADLQFMGNTGSAGYSLVFSPYMKVGFDAGFHAFDAYRFDLVKTRFFKTNRPYTQLGYQLASGKEQVIHILHTQNPRPNLNFGFEYRLITAPGIFVTQNNNHNNYRLFSNYQGKRKRYAAYFTLTGNSFKASENGGMKNDSLLYDPDYTKRFSIPVNLGGEAAYQPNPFKTSVKTGNLYREANFFLRQTYDIGKKDSIAVNDSTTEYLFYPRLRFQHTFMYTSSRYRFQDFNADSAVYQQWYDTTLRKTRDSFMLTDGWKILSNDFSLVQFPDTKNAAQYLLAGIRLENIVGKLTGGSQGFSNLVVHGEYRNKTRNRLWDILANGEFYIGGWNRGDYSVRASLARYLNNKLGNVRLEFQNLNQSPSFIFDKASAFNFKNGSGFRKMNITMISAAAENPLLDISAANYFISNQLYYSDYYRAAQYTKLISLLQVSASKKIRLSKRWNWYASATLQQTDAASPIKVPLVYTRNRIAFEGLFYKNLNLSTGIEFRYNTPFDAYNYSPVLGRFTVQDSIRISNLPDIAAFLHFRIKSFTGYLRAENLNAVSFANGFGFTNNNFAAPHYVYPGFVFRFGIQWGFVN